MARSRKVSAPSVVRELPVSADPAFVRVFADQALVMDLGRDVDFAFLAVGPRLDRVVRHGAGEDLSAEVKVRPQLNEVARVRMAPVGAVTAAMTVIQLMIEGGQANKTAILDAIKEMSEPEITDEAVIADED